MKPAHATGAADWAELVELPVEVDDAAEAGVGVAGVDGDELPAAGSAVVEPTAPALPADVVVAGIGWALPPNRLAVCHSANSDGVLAKAGSITASSMDELRHLRELRFAIVAMGCRWFLRSATRRTLSLAVVARAARLRPVCATAWAVSVVTAVSSVLRVTDWVMLGPRTAALSSRKRCTRCSVMRGGSR